jgi:hypothetical protein
MNADLPLQGFLKPLSYELNFVTPAGGFRCSPHAVTVLVRCNLGKFPNLLADGRSVQQLCVKCVVSASRWEDVLQSRGRRYELHIRFGGLWLCAGSSLVPRIVFSMKVPALRTWEIWTSCCHKRTTKVFDSWYCKSNSWFVLHCIYNTGIIWNRWCIHFQWMMWKLRNRDVLGVQIINGMPRYWDGVRVAM